MRTSSQVTTPVVVALGEHEAHMPGEGARFLAALQEAGINLLAFSGFPERRGSQLDFIPADPGAFKQFARSAKWKLAGPKHAFLVRRKLLLFRDVFIDLNPVELERRAHRAGSAGPDDAVLIDAEHEPV